MSAPILVDVEWLAARLASGDLRIFDTTVVLEPDPERIFNPVPQVGAYRETHIPGAGFLDLQRDFSDTAAPLRFTLPSAQAFAESAGASGISNKHHVVLYSSTNPMWATRFWWMFRTFGHDRVSVLDGGLAAWHAAGKPTRSGDEQYPAAEFSATLDPSRVADKADVLTAIGNESNCVVNALGREQHGGETVMYGRPGHIANSCNVPWSELLDDSGCFLPVDSLQSHFEQVGALSADEVVTYCGGGIAASLDLFALALAGREARVRLYDNSLSEWGRDDSLPMET